VQLNSKGLREFYLVVLKIVVLRNVILLVNLAILLSRMFYLVVDCISSKDSSTKKESFLV
jgi:hypothetical protein